MDIRCRKTTCKYNDKYTCKAKEILIQNKCKCEKYEDDKRKKVEDKTNRIFTNNPPVYAPQRSSATLDIGCKAHCLFNDCGRCVANGITVNDIHENPLCVTFLRK